MFDQMEQPGGVRPSVLYADRIRLVERAEEAGFWGYHKSEHHMTPLDHAPQTGMWLAALAQRTEKIRLCSLVHLLPFHHPIRLIEEICMLDHLSGGRLELGFGKGISPPEHVLWGIDPDDAEVKTSEFLELLLAAFTSTDDLFSFAGDHWDLRDVPLELRPLQSPYPPLWRPGNLETAATLGVSTVVGGPIPRVAEALRTYSSLLEPGIGGGHEPTVGVIRKFIVAPTTGEADAIGRRSWPVYSEHLSRLFRRYELSIPNDPTIGGDYEMAKQVQAIVVGSPAEVHEHICELAESTDTAYVIGGFAFGDLSAAESMRSLELFAEHTVAPLRD